MTRNENPAIGEALDRARETTDPDEERQLYQEAVTEMATDVPYVWLYHLQVTIVAQSNLVNIVNYELPDGSEGLPLHGGAHPLWQIWLRE
jgi:ABC-type transport system substrate-binding protein